MEHIAIIQELIDENREALPTGVTTELMKQCQLVYKAQPGLYRVVWTMVDVQAHVKDDDDDGPPSAQASLVHKTQTLLLEVDLQDTVYGSVTKMMKGLLPKYILKHPMPLIINNGTSMAIVHSVEPYDPRKRTRDA